MIEPIGALGVGAVLDQLADPDHLRLAGGDREDTRHDQQIFGVPKQIVTVFILGPGVDIRL